MKQLFIAIHIFFVGRLAYCIHNLIAFQELHSLHGGEIYRKAVTDSVSDIVLATMLWLIFGFAQGLYGYWRRQRDLQIHIDRYWK